MPRNSVGVYVLPGGNPVASGTTISSVWANVTMADLANEVTNSLDRNGRGGMLAPFRLTAGTAATPGIAFDAEPGMGLFRESAGNLGMSVGGAKIARFNSSSIALENLSLSGVNDALISGNLGLGIGSPLAKLHMNGNGAIFASGGYNFATISQLVSSADAIFGGGVIADGAGTLKKTVAEVGHFIAIQTTDGIRFHVNATGASGTSFPRTSFLAGKFVGTTGKLELTYGLDSSGNIFSTQNISCGGVFNGSGASLTNLPWASLTGRPTNLAGYGITDAYPLSGNPSAFLTGVTSGQVTTALGFTPYNATNPAGYLSSITSGQVTTALGFTPYSAANPNGYISGVTSGQVTTALGFTPYSAANPAGYLSSITSGNVTTALGFTPYNATNPAGYLSSITSGNVTTALGFTPYNATNPSGYVAASSGPTFTGTVKGNSGTKGLGAITTTTTTGTPTGGADGDFVLVY